MTRGAGDTARADFAGSFSPISPPDVSRQYSHKRQVEMARYIWWRGSQKTGLYWTDLMKLVLSTYSPGSAGRP